MKITQSVKRTVKRASRTATNVAFDLLFGSTAMRNTEGYKPLYVVIGIGFMIYFISLL